MIKKLMPALLVIFVPFQAVSQDINRARQIEAAWRGWAQAAGIAETSIAIGFEGGFVRAAGLGRAASEPADIASLSKAITAMCMADVLDENNLTYEARVGDIWDDGRAGALAELTIGQLLSQSTGLDRDDTQDHMRRWLDEMPDRHLEATEIAATRGVNRSEIGQFFYNNENYAVLGLLISELSGEPYIETCKARIFPEQNAGASDRWGAFAAWGGWQVSAEDYLDFVHRYFGRAASYGVAPEGFPKTPVGRGKYYGLGSWWRASRGGGHNFWHFGRLCFTGNNAGAYFASYGGGWSVSVNYEACISRALQNELDARLWRAANE